MTRRLLWKAGLLAAIAVVAYFFAREQQRMAGEALDDMAETAGRVIDRVTDRVAKRVAERLGD